MGDKINYHANSGKNGFMTPGYVLDAARLALGGGFDLDPASSEWANNRPGGVNAARFFDIEDDALLEGRPWIAERLWLNPPFNKNLLFIKKLIAEYRAGRVESACVITYSTASETKWGQMLLDYPRWHPVERVNYIDPDTGLVAEGIMKPSMVTYLGRDTEQFAAAFVGALGGKVDVPYGYFHAAKAPAVYRYGSVPPNAPRDPLTLADLKGGMI